MSFILCSIAFLALFGANTAQRNVIHPERLNQPTTAYPPVPDFQLSWMAGVRARFGEYFRTERCFGFLHKYAAKYMVTTEAKCLVRGRTITTEVSVALGPNVHEEPSEAVQNVVMFTGDDGRLNWGRSLAVLVLPNNFTPPAGVRPIFMTDQDTTNVPPNDSRRCFVVGIKSDTTDPSENLYTLYPVRPIDPLLCGRENPSAMCVAMSAVPPWIQAGSPLVCDGTLIENPTPENFEMSMKFYGKVSGERNYNVATESYYVRVSPLTSTFEIVGVVVRTNAHPEVRLHCLSQQMETDRSCSRLDW